MNVRKKRKKKKEKAFKIQRLVPLPRGGGEEASQAGDGDGEWRGPRRRAEERHGGAGHSAEGVGGGEEAARRRGYGSRERGVQTHVISTRCTRPWGVTLWANSQRRWRDAQKIPPPPTVEWERKR